MSGSNPFDDLAEEVEESDNGPEEPADGGGEEPADGDRSPVEGDASTESVREPSAGRSTSTTPSATDSADAGSPTPDSADAGSPTPDSTAPPDRDAAARDTAIDGPTLSNSSPPFPYSDAEQKQMYVKNGLWNEFEDLEFDAELELRRTFEVRNVEQREIDTAVVRLVLERLSAREIAETVIRMRGFDPSDLNLD